MLTQTPDRRINPNITLTLAVVAIALFTTAATLTVLSGGESSATLTFGGAGDQNVYISIPLNANVTSASIDAQGQATAGVSSFIDSNSQDDFSPGSYTQADFNANDGNGYIYITAGNYIGDYNSPIYDANTTVDWNKLSWTFRAYGCPTGMAYIPRLGGYCIDQYEASHSDATYCDNATTWAGGCSAAYGSSSIPASVPDRIPWSNINELDAATACAAAGKYLCSSSEWYAAANINGQVYYLDDSTTSNTCITDANLWCTDHSYSSGEACNTGSNSAGSPSSCVSSEAVYDMIGNLWEWTNETVDVNADSMAGWWNYPNESVEPNLWGNYLYPSLKYGNDGIYTHAVFKTGRGVLHGGDWYNGAADGGIFSLNLGNPVSYPAYNLGFRCCKAIS